MSNVEQPSVDSLQELIALRQGMAELQATEAKFMQVQEELQASKEQLAVILQGVTNLQSMEQGQYLRAEASRVLATSLDYLAGLSSLVHLVAPVLADWWVVDSEHLHLLRELGFTSEMVVPLWRADGYLGP